MVNWDMVQYSNSQAKNDFNNLIVESQKITPIKPKDEFIEIREKLIASRDEIYSKYEYDRVEKLGYKFDLLFGLKIYKILNNERGFTSRIAGNDDIWKYLSIKVIPDVVHARWDKNADRFYDNSRRIWLKTLWWYIHLSWAGSEEETYKILEKNTTDTILQLVERPGIGYHVDLYRELMIQYAGYPDEDRSLFRNVLKLNTAQLIVSSPELHKDGIEGYVKSLFEKVTN